MACIVADFAPRKAPMIEHPVMCDKVSRGAKQYYKSNPFSVEISLPKPIYDCYQPFYALMARMCHSFMLVAHICVYDVTIQPYMPGYGVVGTMYRACRIRLIWPMPVHLIFDNCFH